MRKGRRSARGNSREGSVTLRIAERAALRPTTFNWYRGAPAIAAGRGPPGAQRGVCVIVDPEGLKWPASAKYLVVLAMPFITLADSMLNQL